MSNNQNTKGKTVLVTGASSGIGLELCQLFAMNGFNVVLVARTKERLENISRELTRKYSVQVEVIDIDLSSPSASQQVFVKLQAKSIHIDILVNNAGFSEYGLFSITDMEKEMQMIQVNIASLTALTKLLLPAMLANKYGKILNVGSTGSFGPGPYNAVYCATKAYVLSFTEAIAEELRGSGVTVTALCPGATKTEFAERAKIEDTKLFQGRLMSAGEVAQIGFQALMRGKTTVVAGCANQITMFSIRLLPRQLVAKIARGMMQRAR